MEAERLRNWKLASEGREVYVPDQQAVNLAELIRRTESGEMGREWEVYSKMVGKGAGGEDITLIKRFTYHDGLGDVTAIKIKDGVHEENHYDLRKAQLMLGEGYIMTEQTRDFYRAYISGVALVEGYGPDGSPNGKGTLSLADEFKRAFETLHPAEPEAAVQSAVETPEVDPEPEVQENKMTNEQLLAEVEEIMNKKFEEYERKEEERRKEIIDDVIKVLIAKGIISEAKAKEIDPSELSPAINRDEGALVSEASGETLKPGIGVTPSPETSSSRPKPATSVPVESSPAALPIGAKGGTAVAVAEPEVAVVPGTVVITESPKNGSGNGSDAVFGTHSKMHWENFNGSSQSRSNGNGSEKPSTPKTPSTDSKTETERIAAHEVDRHGIIDSTNIVKPIVRPGYYIGNKTDRRFVVGGLVVKREIDSEAGEDDLDAGQDIADVSQDGSSFWLLDGYRGTKGGFMAAQEAGDLNSAGLSQLQIENANITKTKNALAQILINTHEKIKQKKEESQDYSDMKTTDAIAKVIMNGKLTHLIAASVGDSRIAVLRGSKIENVTALDNQFLGGSEDIVPNTGRHTLRNGDTILLITNGLGLEDDEVIEILKGRNLITKKGELGTPLRLVLSKARIKGEAKRDITILAIKFTRPRANKRSAS